MGNRRETIMRLAKGFFGRRKNCFSLAIRAVEKGLQKAYIGRKLKKRVVRREWIVQIGAGAREHNISYAKLIFGMRYAEIGVNRKILATLAQQAPPPFWSPLPPPSLSLLVPYSFPYLPTYLPQEPYSFRAIVEEAKLGLKKAVETDPRYAKTPRTKKYPPWLVSLSKVALRGPSPSPSPSPPWLISLSQEEDDLTLTRTQQHRTGEGRPRR